jgi:MinD-like ATPase involved in chromosome partitioning or flagellar assembly
LVALWSATGGSGTSVFTAACAATLARDDRAPAGVRVVDLVGDLAAVFGVSPEPAVGVADWLGAGPAAPAEALDHLFVEVAPRVALLPFGGRSRSLAGAPPEAGAALAAALGESPVPVLADCGVARDPAAEAMVEVADVAVVVVRPCYLALRRAAQSPLLAASAGIVLFDEPGRALRAEEVSDVLGLDVLARVPVRDPIARAVDAGVVASRLPDALARPGATLLARLGVRSGRRGEAA